VVKESPDSPQAAIVTLRRSGS